MSGGRWSPLHNKLRTHAVDLPRAFLLFSQEEKQRGHEDGADGTQGEDAQDQQPHLVGALCLFYGGLNLVQPLSFQESLDFPVGMDVIAIVQAEDSEQKQESPDEADGAEQIADAAVPEQGKYKSGKCCQGAQLQAFGFYAVDLNIFLLDLFFHCFYVSFYQFVQRDMEYFAEPQQAVDVGVGLAGLPVGQGLAGDEDPVGKLLLTDAGGNSALFDLVADFH